MIPTLRLGLAQMTSQPHVDDNLSWIGRVAEQASQQACRALFLPENALWMGATHDVTAVARYMHEHDTLHTLSTLARRYEIHMVLGSYPQWDAPNHRRYNTLVWMDPQGHVLAQYRKRHLFDVQTPQGEAYKESEYFSPGSHSVVVDALGLRFGLSICFDLRFPEHYRELTTLGAQVLLVPSAFTQETGRAHWHTLLRARAVENLAYVLAPAQVGTHATGRKTFGHSLAISPWGDVLLDAQEGPGLFVVDLPMDGTQETLRQRFAACLPPV